MVATQDVVSHLCYTRTAWEDEWSEQPDLECLQFSDVAGPGHASAVFTWRYGVQLRQEIGSRTADSEYQVVDRSDFIGKYVKVVTSNGLSWYGIILDNADVPQGADTLDPEDETLVPEGGETLTAFGLTYLLDLEPIRSYVVEGVEGD